MKTKMYYIGNLGILFLMFASSVFSQNITNTLGTNGVFTIKDAANTFFTLSSLSGEVNILRSLRLENTTNSTLGVLFKGTNRFLHNYGSNNTFLGINSGNFTMSGYGNNTAVGFSSLYSNTTGWDNTAVGNYSLSLNNTGFFNTALGYESLFSNTTGNSNTAVGLASLYSNTTGTDNTALGFKALYFNTGSFNTAVGNNSLSANTTGFYNTAVGNYSLLLNRTGTHSTALGYSSLFSNTTGFNNTAVGFQTLYLNDTGFDNTALGFSTGSNITSGSNLTLLGFNAQPTSGSAINQITLGNNFVSSLRCNVQTITSLSDVRDKKNIQDLSLGLDFLMKVKPRLFNWDKREWYENNLSDGSKMKEAPTAGFIAQELDEVQTVESAEWLDLVLKDNPEKLEATYGNLLPVMVKAIQELKTENDRLKQNNENLSSEVESLKSMNEKIVKLEKMVSELTPVKYTSLVKTEGNKISNKGDVK